MGRVHQTGDKEPEAVRKKKKMGKEGRQMGKDPAETIKEYQTYDGESI